MVDGGNVELRIQNHAADLKSAQILVEFLHQGDEILKMYDGRFRSVWADPCKGSPTDGELVGSFRLAPEHYDFLVHELRTHTFNDLRFTIEEGKQYVLTIDFWYSGWKFVFETPYPNLQIRMSERE